MKDCGVEGAKALASMLLMDVPLTTLNLGCETIILLDMAFKKQRNDETPDCVVQITRSVMKEHVH